LEGILSGLNALIPKTASEPQIVSIMEGEIRYGHFEGFCRSIDLSGRCLVGYHSTHMSKKEAKVASGTPFIDKTISRPFGKCMNLFATPNENRKNT
jgi:hypothetical protein